MKSSLMNQKSFLGETGQLGRSNGTKTNALFKTGTKQLKKAPPSKSGKQVSKSLSQAVKKIKPKGGTKAPIAPFGGGRKTKGSNFQGAGPLHLKYMSGNKSPIVHTALLVIMVPGAWCGQSECPGSKASFS